METPEQCVKFIQKLTIKTQERRQWSRFGAFIVNFGQISHILVLPLPLLTEKVNAGWEKWRLITAQSIHVLSSRSHLLMKHFYQTDGWIQILFELPRINSNVMKTSSEAFIPFLTHLWPIVAIDTSWKDYKIKNFWCFQGIWNGNIDQKRVKFLLFLSF